MVQVSGYAMFCSCKVAIRGARTTATDDVLAHGIIKSCNGAERKAPTHDKTSRGFVRCHRGNLR